MKKTIAIGILALLLMFNVSFVLAQTNIGGTHFGKTPCEQSEANKVQLNFWNPIRIPEEYCDKDEALTEDNFGNNLLKVIWYRTHIYGK